MHVISCHKKTSISIYAVSKGSDQTAHSDLSFDFGIIYMQWRHQIAISLFDVQQADLSFVFLHIFADSFPLDTSQILTRLTIWKKVGLSPNE